MAFNVSSISKYTDEVSQELIKKTILSGDTVDIVSVQPGVKYKQTINILDNTISLQAAACGWNSAGSVAFKQREIEVVSLEIKDSLCQKTLESYFLGMAMKAGTPTENELGPILAESYVEKVKEQVELNIWQGDLSTSPDTYNINGLVKLLSGESTRVTAVYGSPNVIHGPFTAANIVGVVNAMVTYIPEDAFAYDDLTLFMSYANYMMYTAALRTANLFHYDGDSAMGAFVTYIPGTTIKVKATRGLTGKADMILTPASNIVVGTDLMDEEEKFNIWYSQDNDEVRVHIAFKLGVQVRFPEMCVCNF